MRRSRSWLYLLRRASGSKSSLKLAINVASSSILLSNAGWFRPFYHPILESSAFVSPTILADLRHDLYKRKVAKQWGERIATKFRRRKPSGNIIEYLQKRLIRQGTLQ